MKSIFSFLAGLLMLLLTGCVNLPFGGIKTAQPPEPQSVLGDQRQAEARAFLKLLVEGQFDRAAADFTSEMLKALPPDKLKDTWDQLTRQTGTYQKETGIRVTQSGKFKVVIITVQFEKAPLDVKVTYDSNGKVAGLFFSPARAAYPAFKSAEYVGADAFENRDVTVGSGEWALPGVLSLPKGSGPFPAVILVHGSGPNDRDESIGPNKPFRDLAEGLASLGVAVLRYDKRTAVYPDKLAAIKDSITVKDEAVDDAVAAVALLRRTKEIDPQRIYVLGHSLGGMLAPRIGAAAKPAGLIVMAGAARPLEDAIVDQYTYLFNLGGNLTADEQAQLDKIKAQASAVKEASLTASTPADELPLGIPAAYWLDLKGYDPSQAAAGLGLPILVLQGGRDYQVTKADLDLWKTALQGNGKTVFKEYPALNHLFIAGKGAPNPSEYEQSGHVDAAVIKDIVAWIQK
jgi:dienelactone hydrolase